MKELVEAIARALVDHPEDVQVSLSTGRKSPCWNCECIPKTWVR